jgi:hypothetical protein
MSEQQFGAQGGGDPQLELQGIFGKLLGGALGGAIGKRVGGSTGGTIGKIAGGIAGSFLPFDAGPSAQGGAQAASEEAPTDLEVQCFLSVSRKLNLAAGDGAGSLGPLQAGAGAAGSAEPISELELLGFGSFLKKAVGVAKKVVSAGKTVYDVGKTVGVFQAGPGAPAAAAQGEEAISDLEMQAFWSVARRCGHGYGPGTGINPKASMGMFQAGPGGEAVGDLEMQGFWEVVRKIGRAAVRAVDTAGRVVDAGRNAGLIPQSAQQPGLDGIAQALATVQQHLPAIQQLAAQQQGPASAGTRLN